MFLIYDPDSLPQTAREKLEHALDRDRARIVYVGNDGHAEYVVMEARGFKHSEAWSRESGHPLALKE